jgi:exosortase D (VPLPA-CTERM-specific)
MKEKIWNNPLFKPITLLMVFIAAYWIPLKTMVYIWWTDGDYSYGFLIPIISAYMLWNRRMIIKKLYFDSSWKIFPVLVLFVLLSLYGILGSYGNIAMPSIPILIILFTTFCFGWIVIKELIVPLGYLIFMIPIPAVLERTLGLHLKNISTVMGGMIIRLFNIPVNVSGNVIDLGVTKLQVVDACSGFRYLFALLALGVVYAYFFEKILWKRIIIVLSTIPIAVIANIVRIGITGILTSIYGVSVAEGFFHGFSGWAIFIFAFACLFVVDRILALLKSSEKPQDKIDQIGNKSESSFKTIGSKNINGAFYTSICLLVIVGLLTLSTDALPPVKLKGGIESFPIAFGEWKGESQIVTPEIIIESGAEEAFSASFSNKRQESFSLYMGYRSSAFLSNENFFHSPTVCLPSSGWTIISKSTHVITNIPRFGNLEVSQLIMEEMGEQQLVYYWFQTKDKTTPNRSINRFHLTLHALKRDNTYDFFIRPITTIKAGENIEDTQVRMDGFVRDMMEALMKFLSENQN